VTSIDWPSLRSELELRYDEYRAQVAEAFQADPSGSAAPAFPDPYRTSSLAQLDIVERVCTVFELDAAPTSLGDAAWASTVDDVLARLSTKIPVINFAKWSRKSMPYIGGKSVLEVVETSDHEALTKLESQLLATR